MTVTPGHSFYRTVAPPEALRPFIRSLWVYDGHRPEHARERVLPTGTLEIVVPLGGKRLAWQELTGRAGQCGTALVSGPRHSAFDVPTAPQGRLVGAHFHPGGAWPLFAIPMDAIAEGHHTLEELLGASARALADQIVEARSDTERLAMLGAYFLRRARTGRSSHAAVRAAVRSIRRSQSLPPSFSFSLTC